MYSSCMALGAQISFAPNVGMKNIPDSDEKVINMFAGKKILLIYKNESD